MRERHWQKISEDIGLTIPIDDPKFTLTDVLEMGLPSHMEAIMKVTDVASKEYGIEMALQKMFKEWEGANLDVKEYRDTGRGLHSSTSQLNLSRF